MKYKTIDQILTRINTVPCNGQLTSTLKQKAKKLGYELEGFFAPTDWKPKWRYRVVNKLI